MVSNLFLPLLLRGAVPGRAFCQWFCLKCDARVRQAGGEESGVVLERFKTKNNVCLKHGNVNASYNLNTK